MGGMPSFLKKDTLPLRQTDDKCFEQYFLLSDRELVSCLEIYCINIINLACFFKKQLQRMVLGINSSFF